jgi:hypothetical protein
MYIYKFRITIDEIDDFVRDIEVAANQTFEDFFCAITNCTELNSNTLSSFFVCDSKWRRRKELTLIDMGIDESRDEDRGYDEDDFEDTPKIPIRLMKQEKISEAIDDPHQRIILMYDYIKPTMMYIELLKTKEALDDINYPRCTFQEGKLPVTLKNNFPVIGAIGDDEFENLADVDEEDVPDIDIVDDVLDEEDIEGLDGLIDDFEGGKF